jgi:TonB-linked SusC/RagA family outer membrane protein
MKKIVISALMLLFALSSSLYAQERTITGKVSDASDGSPLPGVNIAVVGTSQGTITDMDGNYSIKVSSNNVSLSFSFLGYETKTVQVGDQTVINVALNTSDVALDDVVITALGIKREKKALTYSAEDVKGDELTKVKDANPMNSLSGKVAGLTINRSAAGTGGSVKVLLRGNSSTTNNQPLYVIDGMPMLNYSPNQQNDIWGSVDGQGDGGDGISMINPDDIESITVLKGASASVLYGSQGANGVILITTKSGKAGKTRIDFSSNFTIDKVAYLPDFQFEYGSDPGALYSWGDKKSSPDFINDFYQTGQTFINAITLTGGNERATTYLSYANTKTIGIIPENDLVKHNLNLRHTTKYFNDKLKVDANIILTSQTINNKPTAGLYFNPLTGLYLFPRGEDFQYYKDNFELFDPARNIMAQQWPVDKDYEQNPYWGIYRNPSEDNNLRAIASITLAWTITDWLSIQARGNVNKAYNSFDKKVYATTQGTLSHSTGRYILSKTEDTQLYGDLIATINKNFSEDLSFSANIGTSITDYTLGDKTYHDSGIAGGLTFTNEFFLQNFVASPSMTMYQSMAQRKQVQSVFASASLGFKNMLYLDLSGRNDWSSTLAFTDNNSYFYPSVGLTAILTEMLSLPDLINFGKVRVSYAQVGNDVPSFETNILATSSTNGSLVAPNRTVLTTLEPEQQKSWEIGTDWKFFNNKLGFDFSWYKTNTTNQYFLISAPPSSGYEYYSVNAGNIENKGVEFSLYATVMQSGNFSWNTALNFARNKNTVISLHEDLGGEYPLTPTSVNNYTFYIAEGEPFGQIRGKVIKRDEQGRIVVDANGNPIANSNVLEPVGNPNPDFTMGWNNTFSYKNLTLYFLIDGRFGGEVMSITEAMLDEHGVSKRSADARNNGGVDIDAVYEDGTPVTGKLDAEAYYTAVGGRDGFTGEYVYDATNIRLRELSLGYKFKLSNTNVFKSLNLSFIARNLFFIYKEAPYDPDISLSTGNGLQGVDVFAIPTTRSFGFNLKVSF